MRIVSPASGYTMNPLMDLSRNVSCICGSDKKIKKCCGRSRYISNDAADEISKYLSKLPKETLIALGVKFKGDRK